MDTSLHNGIDEFVDDVLKCNKSLYSFETDKYRIDIAPKKLDDCNADYPGIKKLTITIRDATFAARKKKNNNKKRR